MFESIERIITLPDIHYPDNISLASIEKFMTVFKPTHLVYLGDLLDLSYMGKFARDNERCREGKRIKDDYGNVSDMVAKHKKLCNNPYTVYCLGNHEQRIEYEIDHTPALEGLIEIETNIGHLFDEILPFGDVWEANPNLGYTHGYYFNTHHAKKTTQEFGRMSVIYGHTHDRQLHTKMNLRDKTPKPRYAQSIGCLCNLSPDYLRRRGRNNKWVHAFSIAYLWGNGFFNEYTIHIIDGKFCYNGRIYE